MKKKLNLLIEQEARTEIDHAYDWYESKVAGLGDEFTQSLNDTFEAISNSPSGATKFGRHRQIPMKRFPFVILYEVVHTELYIDAVFHTSQNPEKKPS